MELDEVLQDIQPERRVEKGEKPGSALEITESAKKRKVQYLTMQA
jgi:hypothetical protein